MSGTTPKSVITANQCRNTMLVVEVTLVLGGSLHDQYAYQYARRAAETA